MTKAEQILNSIAFTTKKIQLKTEPGFIVYPFNGDEDVTPENRDYIFERHGKNTVVNHKGMINIIVGQGTQNWQIINEDNNPIIWGGPREGAGRPATGRKKQNFYITDEENEKLRAYLKELRNPAK